jgi:hypothetical protein
MTTCPDCGVDHHPEAVEAAAEVEAAEVIAEGVEGAAHEEGRADVEVAKVEADRDVEVARINAKVEAGWQEARVVELEGQVSGMREIIDRLTAPPAEPGPEPAPAVEVVDEPAEPPPPEDKPAPPAPKKKRGWWD